MLIIFVFTQQASYAAPPVITGPSPAVLQPQIIISSFGGGMPEFFELYNQGATPYYVGNMEIHFTIQGSEGGQLREESFIIPLPDGWLLPKQYLMTQQGIDGNSNIVYYETSSDLQNASVQSVSLVDARAVQYVISSATPVIAGQWAQHKQRGNATIKLQGVFTADYSVKTTPPTGSADKIYAPPLTVSGLQILEILPNAQDCPPYSEALDCGDYIKLYNPTGSAIDLGLYRLRTDSGGSKSSATNTLTLAGSLLPGEYLLVQRKDSDEAISLTNTGGYVWLEDRYGVTTYRETIAQYPDSSSVKTKGLSWALDNAQGVWRWMVPSPNAANQWLPDVSMQNSAEKAPPENKDCGIGKERNPETNRCRNIPTTVSVSPCKEGQERNPATNRCRSTQVSATSQKACNANQYRNPETGRCKNKTTAHALTPCKKDQERNHETNRCRKKVTKSKDIAQVQDVSGDHKKSNTTLFFIGAGAVMIVGYGVYEWRQDIAVRLARIRARWWRR